MLKRDFRIPKDKFPKLSESKFSTSTPHFTLRFVPTKEEHPRIAVIVSKKISKSAVVRNSIRRRTYSTLRTRLPKLKIGTYLFFAKSGAEKARAESLKEELSLLLKALERS